jgi:acyl carrier protein
VKDRLDRCADQVGEAVVEETLRRFVEIDRQVYADLLEHRGDFRELLDPARRTPRTGNGAGREPSPAALANAAMGIVSGSLGIRSEVLEPGTSLSTLGFDSLNLLATISAIEEAFRVELSPSDIAGLTTLDDLIEKVADLASRQH